VFGQTVDLLGKIVDEQAAPVSGASVKLMNIGATATTGSDGAYHLITASAGYQSRLSEENIAVFLRGRELHLACASPEPVAVEWFAANGRHMRLARPSMLAKGLHTIPLALSSLSMPGSSCGICVVNIGDRQYRFKAALLDGNFSAAFCPVSVDDRPRASKVAVDVIVDTMRITKTGYDTVRICIGQYADVMPDVYLTTPSGYPRMILNNAATVLTMYKPDAATGYCRGSRFDWSGIIGRVKCIGHVWYADYTTGTHDPLAEPTGTAGEFGIDSVNGYGNQAFLKIGVGKLLGTGGAYNFRTNYQILDPGVWTVTRGKYWMQFSHQIAMVNGYDYDYVKRITIGDSTPVYTLDYYLKNTGTKSIVTDHYTHNFSLIDDKPVAGNYKVTLGFAPTLQQQTSAPGSWASMTTINGKVISITATLNGSDYLWATFGGRSNTVADNSAIVTETTGKAALKIEGDWVPYKYNFWASPRSVCPEPYITVNLNPGEEMQWKDTYTAYPNGVQ
jgi:hypothetical protein